MKLNLAVDQTLSVNVRDKSYPVAVAGKGLPCLAIGIGTLMQRSLSERFKNHFKVYSSDLYWDEKQALDNPTTLTMQQLVDDIVELAKNLGLTKSILIGHSAFGIVALEAAKHYPEAFKGVIMVGTPLNSNLEVAKRNNAYFEKHADIYRKQIDAERRKQVAQEDLSSLSPSQKFLREYTYRDAPRYWHDPSFDCTPLWEGIVLDKVIDHFFGTILPQTDVTKDLHKVQCPVFLAAGKSDYDCCPWEWVEVQNQFPLTISYFEESGHYPNYEEALFDKDTLQWVKDNL